MIGKLSFVLLAFLACQGYCITEHRLEDRDVLYIRHSHFSTSFSIPKNFWDTLSSCHVIFPNGVTYEVYPNYNIPLANVYFLAAAQPFTSCGIGLRDVDVSFSGTYELLSNVVHSGDNRVSVTRQRFNLVVRESDFSKNNEKNVNLI